MTNLRPHIEKYGMQTSPTYNRCVIVNANLGLDMRKHCQIDREDKGQDEI